MPVGEHQQPVVALRILQHFPFSLQGYFPLGLKGAPMSRLTSC